MIWLTGDWHHQHLGILRHSNRPFETLEEMHDALIKNTNKVVQSNHTLIILGDYSFEKDINIIKEFTKRIKCKNKILILGNHDVKKIGEYYSAGFQNVQHYLKFKYNHIKYCCSHFPMLTWDGAHRGSIMLHAHSHGNLNDLNLTTRRLDVGVDCFDYRPISIDEVELIMSTRTYKPVDHHR